jgi:hypothetical protein
LSIHLHLGLPSSFFHSGSPTNILYAFIFSPIRATSHPSWLDHSNYVWRREQLRFNPYTLINLGDETFA